MRFRILTIFPELFGPFLATSLVGRAIERGLLDVEIRDLREFTLDRHRSVDDEPYGGGGGMVMTAEPWLRAVRAVDPKGEGTRPPLGRGPSPTAFTRIDQTGEGTRPPLAAGASPAASTPPRSLARARSVPLRILMSPQGRRLDEAKVRELAEVGDFVLLCGRYEAIDERVLETVVDEEVSIGDYVLSGGELPAMVLVEALSRQIPGVVQLAGSVENDSFRGGLLDYPHYTRPAEIEGLAVPPVLLSGDHAAIDEWRERQALRATARKRPDLLAGRTLSPRQRAWLAEVEAEGVGKAPARGAKEPPDLP